MPFEEQKDNGISNTDVMNSEISYDEVSDAINSSKFKKWPHGSSSQSVA